MTEYATREAAIEALLEYVAAHPLCRTASTSRGWYTQSVPPSGVCKAERFLFPAPVVIPPDLTTVWVRDEDDEGWELRHSKGTLDMDGWLCCYGGTTWKFWTTEEPEGWRK